MTLPNFLVIGAQRSGTTWLDQQLRHHPSIYLPEIRKEVHFFNRYYYRGLDWYQKFFPISKEASQYQWIGEITPNYMEYPEVPQLIYKHMPDCKLILILRNPADRLYSHYSHSIRNQNYQKSFNEFMQQSNTFTMGLYAEHLQRYLKYFPLDNFLILIFEETIVNPQLSLKKIAKFLSIDDRYFDEIDYTKKVNYSYRPRFAFAYSLARNAVSWLRKNDLDWVFNNAKKMGVSKKIFGVGQPIPKLDTKLRKNLLSRYEDNITDLEKMLGKDLSIWRT